MENKRHFLDWRMITVQDDPANVWIRWYNNETHQEVEMTMMRNLPPPFKNDSGVYKVYLPGRHALKDAHKFKTRQAATAFVHRYIGDPRGAAGGWYGESRRHSEAALKGKGSCSAPIERRHRNRFTIIDIKRQNKAAGHHFFDKDSMAFFHSKILPRVYEGAGGVYFITSEHMDFGDPPRYQIRKFNPVNGHIGVGGAGVYYPTHAQAKADAKKLAEFGPTGVYELAVFP